MRATRLHLLEQCFKYIEREFETVHLLRINGQIDLRGRGHFAKLPHARHKLGHDARMLRIFVTWMQRGELDGDAVRIFWALGGRSGMRLGEVFYGVFVAGKVAICILHRARAFAEHVKAEAQIAGLAALRLCLLERLFDGLPKHELLCQQLHGAYRGCDHGLRTQLAQQSGRLIGLGQGLF